MAYATVLVHLESGAKNTAVLHAAGLLAERANARVIGIAARKPVEVFYGEGMVSPEAIREDRRHLKAELEAAEGEFRAALQGHCASQSWMAKVLFTSVSDFVVAESRCADLVVTGSSGPLFNPGRQADPSDVVLRAGRPVLVVPRDLRDSLLDRVLIAWNDSRESRLAVLNALPLLQRASHVGIVELAPGKSLAAASTRVEEVARWAQWHAIKAEAFALPSTGDDATYLDAVAREQAADVIVAGAYGHSRLREWALGGVTKELLASTERCALLSH
jgi:nucleotide-binding universal stress UspA family protein